MKNTTLGLLLAVTSLPSGLSALELVRAVPSKYWAQIECYRDSAHNFTQEKYLNKLGHRDSEVVAAFGSQFPATETFLLHYGPKWNVNKGKTVLLIHGASDNATRAWAVPDMLLKDNAASKPGLLSALEKKGFRVFAVTFAHKHGNLFYEAEHLASAIALIKAKTGEEKISLVGHSGGGLVGRMYVSSYKYDGSFTSYRGDVDNLITLAAPHRGQDFVFRHTAFNYFLNKDDFVASAPMSWDKLLFYGIWQDSFEYSIYSDNFPMQQQILSDWSDRVKVNMFTTPDWYTTYNGGLGFVSHSYGIEDAIKKGGNFIRNFKNYPVSPEVPVTVIAGTNNNIPGMSGTESDGPSDGLIFVDSASSTEDLASPERTDPILALKVNASHMTITYSDEMLKLIPLLLK